MSRRYSTSSATSTTPLTSYPLANYPYRQSFLEIRNGQEYMTMLPPMTTEEDLLQEDMLDQPVEYTSYGPFPERDRRPKLLRALAEWFRKLRRSLGKRR
ncbi:hypothetical protein C8Q80DRAFT_466541 [Daedaleopsis nitida]|nr:hypothetical protein C8Q80DRAFT_466541 [Daedaleopsis nitida]